MMLYINGQARQFDELGHQPTLSALLSALKLPSERGVAVAINDQVVPRSQWEQAILNAEDRVEVIHATQGG